MKEEMSDETQVPLSPREEEALRMAEGMPVRPASPEAKERARAAFLRGAAVPGREPSTVVSRRIPRLVPLALAASLMALGFYGLAPTDAWVVLGAADGTAVDGSRVSTGDHFTAGRGETASGGYLDVQLGERLRVVVSEDTRVRLPAGPGRWLGRTRVMDVQQGEILGTTGRRKLGYVLVVHTPEADARILGTTFAVTRNPLGTCVCLLEGSIDVTCNETGQGIRIPAGQKVQIFEDGQSPTLEALSSDDLERLQALETPTL